MKKLSINKIIYIIIILGIILRGIYISYTPITDRQHDVYDINSQGHLGYIYTIYETGKLPTNNDVQFYHPPLFHITASLWLKAGDTIGLNFDKNLEGLQVLTAIYSSLIIIVAYKILKRINIKEIYKILVMAIMAFHPTFIILAGSINNDVLMILLSFVIILYLMKWYEKTTFKNTILLAIFTGLCVMTKISGAVMAVTIAYVFIKRMMEIIKTKEIKIYRLLALFLIFGLISLPIGLAHPIRNYILFHQQIGGVLLPSESYYIGNYNFFERFLSIPIKEFFVNTFCSVPGDYNIIAYIIKSSLFGEWTFSNTIIISTILKYINFVIITASTLALLIINVKPQKNGKNNFIIEMFSIIHIMNIISYIAFNLSYPYTCTMDFRYLVPNVFTGMIFLVLGLERLRENEKLNNLSKFFEYLIIIFCIFSIVMLLEI